MIQKPIVNILINYRRKHEKKLTNVVQKPIAFSTQTYRLRKSSKDNTATWLSTIFVDISRRSFPRSSKLSSTSRLTTAIKVW
mmetsp:Transcript_29472/g.90186  ORF Transcript_29472/g.90186 Transcript_29472/m.90186 type:complete len:82 (-) Transcript_29472:403-648(-)